MINRDTFHRLEDAIDEFEELWLQHPPPQIEDLLADHQLQHDHQAIAELIRVDIEYRYERGQAIELEDYLSRFAALRQHPQCVAEIAFEDYRLRDSKGFPLRPDRYRDLPGVAGEAWFQDLSAWETSRSRRSGRATRPKLLADPSEDIAFQTELQTHGFELVQLLGSGAFSHVYLATQSQLADRFVVLKIVGETLSEPERMAALQHTNIVPLYSCHRILSRSVLCMPYAGAVTLNDFLACQSEATKRSGQGLLTTVRMQRDSTVLPGGDCERAPRRAGSGGEEATSAAPLERLGKLDSGQLALWMFARLAAALAHAHARGVLHNDLKPSNVLIRNDGEPALLDFNLAQPIGQRRARHVGGTLPYMSPETFRALMGQDEPIGPASDLYALGVMLFEYVTGRLPFAAPASPAEVDLAAALQARRGAPDWRPEDRLTPGLKAIIERCLRPDPVERYQNAEQLRGDLQREAEDRPLAVARESRRWQLRKWTRRHPRLVSSTLVAILLLAVALPVAYQAVVYQRSYRQLSAQATLESFAAQSHEFLAGLMVDPERRSLDRLQAGHVLLQRHGLLAPEAIEQQLTWLPPAERPRLRGTLMRHVGHLGILEAKRLLRLQRLEAEPVDAARLRQLIAVARVVDGGTASRARLLLQADAARVAAASGQANAGTEQANAGAEQASAGTEQASALQASALTEQASALTEQASALPIRGETEMYLEAVRLLSEFKHVRAREWLTALADRDSVPAGLRWTLLGRAQFGDEQYEEAKLSYTQSIERAPHSSQLYVMRGRCYFELRQGDAALRDYQEAIELDAGNRSAWSHMGLIYHARQRFDDALRCFNRSLAISPGRIWTLLKRSQTYRALGRTEEAEADFRSAMQAETDDPNALVYRALARTQVDPEAALGDLRVASELHPERPYIKLEIARILAVELERYAEAEQRYAEVLREQPGNEVARIDRALSLVRLGRGEEALRETRLALAEPNRGRTLYQAACVHALIDRPANRRRAVTLLAGAIRAGYRPRGLMADPDLRSLHELDGFQAIHRFYEMSLRGRPRPRRRPPDLSAARPPASSPTSRLADRPGSRSGDGPRGGELP